MSEYPPLSLGTGIQQLDQLITAVPTPLLLAILVAVSIIVLRVFVRSLSKSSSRRQATVTQNRPRSSRRSSSATDHSTSPSTSSQSVHHQPVSTAPEQPTESTHTAETPSIDEGTQAITQSSATATNPAERHSTYTTHSPQPEYDNPSKHSVHQTVSSASRSPGCQQPSAKPTPRTIPAGPQPQKTQKDQSVPHQPWVEPVTVDTEWKPLDASVRPRFIEIDGGFELVDATLIPAVLEINLFPDLINLQLTKSPIEISLPSLITHLLQTTATKPEPPTHRSNPSASNPPYQGKSRNVHCRPGDAPPPHRTAHPDNHVQESIPREPRQTVQAGEHDGRRYPASIDQPSETEPDHQLHPPERHTDPYLREDHPPLDDPWDDTHLTPFAVQEPIPDPVHPPDPFGADSMFEPIEPPDKHDNATLPDSEFNSSESLLPDLTSEPPEASSSPLDPPEPLFPEAKSNTDLTELCGLNPEPIPEVENPLPIGSEPLLPGFERLDQEPIFGAPWEPSNQEPPEVESPHFEYHTSDEIFGTLFEQPDHNFFSEKDPVPQSLDDMLPEDNWLSFESEFTSW